MSIKKSGPVKIKSIPELHSLFHLNKPDHPLVSVIDFENIKFDDREIWESFFYDFYCVACKIGSSGKFKYGQRDYDFDDGMMSFTKPGQIFSVTNISNNPVTGFMLVFKADFIRHSPLGKVINTYGFFSYAIAEALHLSEKENEIIMSLLQQIKNELKNNIDNYSQDLVISHIDLLLNYSRRFHNRQFLTRNAENNDLLIKIEEILRDYLNTKASISGLPTVKYLSEELNMSPSYLSDMLRNLLGQNAQTYIQNFIINEAKDLISTTNLSVKEIAYNLGFQHPQSFSSMFKKKTHQTPLQYRASFN
ncbi:helix-turn-helix transcriptional regulator [Galbibacter sp. PAP.153]|uniref:helix-turn-helix domain-containing protein n=1 Tax=Galbibacter sp. PAP.153 TaxID=3104623 RepID=UPI00300A7036